MRRSERCPLIDLGFSVETYGETVIAFYNDNYVVINIMPMGFKLDSKTCTLNGRIFNGSILYKLITEKNLTSIKCSICVTKNPQLFYLSIFDKRKILRRFDKGRCPRSYCDVCIHGMMHVDEVTSDYIKVFFRPLSIKYNSKSPKVFDRASAAVIEALVWYTKMPYVSCGELDNILIRLRMCLDTVLRASTNEKIKNIINDVYSKAVQYAESSRCRSGNKNL